ncbi:MAG TPA: NTP transferase domain-containing protein [Anaerolineae bacterium]|nr:NTP transferase domain-containing protein [Anaerolineae bacterium]
MDILILAGGIPGPDDPLYPATQGNPKALIDVAGKPMVQCVLDAVSGANHTDHVVLVGLEENGSLHCEKPLHFIPDQVNLLDNVLTGIQKIQEIHPQAEHALVLGGDLPAITSQMVDWRIESMEGSHCDVEFTAIERTVMESRFPGSNRSYVKLKDVEVCGGDVHGMRLSLAGKRDLWERLIDARKNIFKQAALIGFDTLFLLVTRSMTLKRAESLVSKRLGIVGKATLSPYAEMGMDVDKPFQLEIMRRDLSSNGEVD